MVEEVMNFELSRGGKPIPFTIAGEPFQAKGEVNGGLILSFAKQTTAADPDDPAQVDHRNDDALTAVTDFFKAAIHEDYLPRFQELLDSTEEFITITELVKIMNWLAGKYTNPTGELSPSSSPGKRTGRASTRGRSAKVLTYSRPD